MCVCEYIGTKAWHVNTCFFKLLFLMHLALDVLSFFCVWGVLNSFSQKAIVKGDLA